MLPGDLLDDQVNYNKVGGSIIILWAGTSRVDVSEQLLHGQSHHNYNCIMNAGL